MRQNGQPHYSYKAEGLTSYKAERLTLNEAEGLAPYEAENVLYASTNVAII